MVGLMKTFYRKAYGCFICTDRYRRPWWWPIRSIVPTSILINDRYRKNY